MRKKLIGCGAVICTRSQAVHEEVYEVECCIAWQQGHFTSFLFNNSTVVAFVARTSKQQLQRDDTDAPYVCRCRLPLLYLLATRTRDFTIASFENVHHVHVLKVY
jgi:hypothetical protein